MSRSPHWGWSWRSMDWRLILCGLGFHKWYFMCRGRNSIREDVRHCWLCETKQDIA